MTRMRLAWAGAGVLMIGLTPIETLSGPGPIDPGPVPPRVVFSTEVSFTATGGPHAGELVSHGDELGPAGVIVHTNQDLAGAFCQQPPFFDVGLDAIHHRRQGRILFSSELGWFDECLGVQVSDGDLLLNDGTIVKTNGELMANFHPMPSVPDVGLDGVHELFFGEIYFSIEVDIFDEVLGVVLRHGDVLSDQGYVVATNAYLVRNFCIKPVFPDLGLDGLFLPGNGEIWFSTEEGFFDECGKGQISDGDLLSDAGYIVATNRQLTDGFFDPTGPATLPLGLDAVWVDMCIPFSGCGTLNFGPQGCPIFQPDDGSGFYFIENTGSFGAGDRVWVNGCLNPNSPICGPFIAPGIENNTIGRCFEGCGVLGPAPHGCTNPLLNTDDGQLYAIENADGFTFGDRVWVKGCVNDQSLICFPPFNPAIEDNTIGRCFEGCGVLAFGPQGCLVLQTNDGESLFIENTGAFGAGDRVFVRGCLNPDSLICPPFTAPGIEDNTITDCQACCFVDGNCALLPAAVCEAQGGLPQGPGSQCGALSCLQACCFDDTSTISCQNLPPGDCVAQGGRPGGLGTNCHNTICVPAAQIVSVCSMKVHRPFPGPAFPCCLPVSGAIPNESSEPRLGVSLGTSVRGITDIHITFDRPLHPSAFGLNGAAVHIAETTTAIYPAFQPYSGSSVITTGGADNVLVLRFAPGLEHARAYRVALSPQVTSVDQRFDVRGLVGDVNSDGRVNATDRSIVVGVWTGSGFTCETDLNLDAVTNATDRSILIGVWTSGNNSAP